MSLSLEPVSSTIKGAPLLYCSEYAPMPNCFEAIPTLRKMPVKVSPLFETRPFALLLALFALVCAALAFDTPSFAVSCASFALVCAALAFETPSFAVRCAASAAVFASTPLSYAVLTADDVATLSLLLLVTEFDFLLFGM